MPTVNVTISGKTYRIACGEGEEAHLESLAANLDTQVEIMRQNFGEIGDMRLLVMTALTFADDTSESKRRIMMLEQEVARLKDIAYNGQSYMQAQEKRIAETVMKTAEKVENLTRAITQSQVA